jgi:hypothetical protein
MIPKIGIAAAALVAFFAANDASFAASKNRSAQTNSYRDLGQCFGGSCTSVNPDRIPNTSAQFYRSSHKKQKNHKSS